MARPQKQGLDYFPLDTDMDLKDDKVQLVEAKYGVIGFSVLIKLLMKIYSEGYYYQWGENEGLLFSKRANVDINTINDIVNDLVKWGMFDADIFRKYSVLTSNGIQKRYWEVAKRRNDVIIDKTYWIHNVDIVLVSANINLINVDSGTQRIVKKRIVKESKEKNMKFITCQHLSMTEEEYQKLCDKYTKSRVDDKIEYARNYKGLTKYVSLYLTLNNWLKADKGKEEKKSGNPFLTLLQEGNL